MLFVSILIVHVSKLSVCIMVYRILQVNAFIDTLYWSVLKVASLSDSLSTLLVFKLFALKCVHIISISIVENWQDIDYLKY